MSRKQKSADMHGFVTWNSAYSVVIFMQLHQMYSTIVTKNGKILLTKPQQNRKLNARNTVQFAALNILDKI
jgi:hypothetical protein